MTKRKPKRDYSVTLPRRSVPEILGRFESELAHQANNRGLKFFDVKLTAEALMNAIILNFLDLPEEERNSALDLYLRKLELMLSIESPPGEGPPDDKPPIRTGEGRTATPRKKGAS